MASRIFWIFLAGLALIAGIATQERNWLLGWTADAGIERSTDAAIEARVEQAIESRFDGTPVVISQGRTVDVTPQTSRELGEAVRRLVAAETELALMRVGDSGEAAAAGARSRRDAARAEVDRLKAEIERHEGLSQPDRDRIRQQVQEGVRSSVRETIRTAVRG